MKKDKRFLKQLGESLGDIDSKYKEEILLKYENIIMEEKAKKRKITEILSEIGNPKDIAELELKNYNKYSFIYKIKNFFSREKDEEKETLKRQKKEEKLKAKELKLEEKRKKQEEKERVKEAGEIIDNEEKEANKSIIKEKWNSFVGFISRDINLKKKKKEEGYQEVVEDVKENFEDIKEDFEEEIADVSEIVTEDHVFESKKHKTKRIILKTLGVILTSLLFFIWLWLCIVFIASVFAYLDGVKFIGLVIALFGLTTLFLWIIIMINKLIFKKSNNLKINLAIIITCIILIALGVVLFVRKIYKIEKVEDVSIKYSMTNKISTYTLSSNPDQKFTFTFNSNYNTQYTINYDDTLNDKVKLEVKYFECYYDYYVKESSNNVYVSLKLDNRDRLSVYIDDFKENKIFDNDELSRYSVKISISSANADRLVIKN